MVRVFASKPVLAIVLVLIHRTAADTNHVAVFCNFLQPLHFGLEFRYLCLQKPNALMLMVRCTKAKMP
jgi:hypothetical protein